MKKPPTTFQTVSCRILNANLCRWGCEVVAIEHGQAARIDLPSQGVAPLAIADWALTDRDRIETRRRSRQSPQENTKGPTLLNSASGSGVTHPLDMGKLRVPVREPEVAQ